jgi:16S rRNA (uracil1498-N3)-methyltransferase
MDYIIQKSTELGVGMIQPFLSHRCIQKWDSERKRKKSDHWNRIILESVKQSGIRRPPVLMPVADFSAIIGSDYKGYTKIILWEQAKSKHLREILHEKDPTKPVIFVIGPEGGFTGDEAERARQYGFETISLGNSILRSETAALAVLSILNYEAGIIG